MSLDLHAPAVPFDPAPPSARAGGASGGARPEPATGGSPNAGRSPADASTSLGSLSGPTAPGRSKVRAVTVSAEDGRYRVQVDIERGGDRALGLAHGPLVASAGRRLVAEAALEALSLLGTGAERGAIEAVAVSTLGAQQVALVTVVMDARTHEETHVGAAVVRSTGEHDAVARAVLDATNRRLGTRS